MKNVARLFALLAAFAALCGSAHAAVIMRGAAEVKGNAVRLSDVFDGLPDGLDRDIARAPAPGKSVTYNVNILVNLAHQYHLDWQPQSLGDHLTVTTACTRLNADDIRKAAAAQVRQSGINGNVEIVLDKQGMEINLPADRPPNFFLSNFDYDSSARRFRATLMADGGDEQIATPVSGRVLLRHDVPVLNRRLEGGAVIGESDIEWKSVEEDRAGDMVAAKDQLVGMQLRRVTEEGVVLHARDVMEPRLVSRGGLVTIKIETPALLVTAQGKALQDGKLGDTVRVINTQSSRTVEGVVESDGSVRIPTAQKFAAVAHPEEVR